MSMNPPAAVARAATNLQPSMSEDALKAIQGEASRARDLEAAIADAEERLRALNASLNEIYHKTLPDMMQAAGIDTIGLPASGNLPAMDARLVSFYSASIAASWPIERRQAAFAALTKLGHEDLIKTTVEISFPRDQRAKVKKFLAGLKKQKLSAEVSEAVHSGTLKAWLKEQVEGHRKLPPLDVIGASVGQVVKLKERKE